MKPKPHHIQTIGDGAVFAMQMPVADTIEQDITALQAFGISKVLCLQETAESAALGLEQQESICQKNKIQFQRFEIPDYGVPEYRNMQSLISDLQIDLNHGTQLLVHCRGGIGRTGLICSCLAITTGLSADQAMDMVSTQRGHTVPETDAQIALIRRFEADYQS